MKNKLLVFIVTAVYLIGMLSLPAFAEEATAPEVTPPPQYVVTSVYNNTIGIGESRPVYVSLSSANGQHAATITAVVSCSTGLTADQFAYGMSYTTGGFGLTFNVNAPLSAEGAHTVTLNLNMYDSANVLLGTQSVNVPINVVNNTDPEGLTFETFSADLDSVKSGDEFNLMFILENNTGVDLEDVKVTLPGLDPSKFVMDGGFTYKTVDIKNGGQAVVAFELIACDGISSVRETLTASAQATVAGEKVEAICDVILTCEPTEQGSVLDDMSLTVVEYKSSSDRIRPERTFTLTVKVKNTSEKDIDKARINIGNLDGRVFAINSGLTYRDFSIEAGETKTFEFVLIGCDGISSTREVLPIELSYGNVHSTVQCTLSCKPEEKTQPDTAEVFAPNIIITDYDFGGEFVVAGQKFPLTVSFKNVSSEAVIENLKIVIDGGSSANGGIAFSASNSANSFFFEKLDLSSTDQVVMEMLAKSDATPNSYPIDISFSYEYTVNGRRYQAPSIHETLNVPLQQEDRLVVNDPSYPNWVVYVGESCYVSTSLVNMGKSGVYNVTASIQGEGFTMNEASYYIGNIESGREEYYDTEIFPDMAGEISCELVVTYEDSNGNAKEKRIPFTVQTQEMVMWDEPVVNTPIGGEMMGDGYYDEFGNWIPAGGAEEGKLPIWAYYAIGGGGALVLLTVVIIIIVSVKKKKKAALEAEYDDEDI